MHRIEDLLKQPTLHLQRQVNDRTKYYSSKYGDLMDAQRPRNRSPRASYECAAKVELSQPADIYYQNESVLGKLHARLSFVFTHLPWSLAWRGRPDEAKWTYSTLLVTGLIKHERTIGLAPHHAKRASAKVRVKTGLEDFDNLPVPNRGCRDQQKADVHDFFARYTDYRELGRLIRLRK